VTLCDAGPLIALIDRGDVAHQDCAAALAKLPATGLVTTWPCFTEAMHLLRRAGGLPAQNELWGFIADGLVRLHLPGEGEWRRMHELMNQYADMPLDMADASLMSAAESMQHFSLLSLDARLRAVKLANGRSFAVFP
jgi:uncharacterized protein